ncbi:alpha/beta hydrolase [Alginatibacterium sediminis]|uniref:Alpha/beta hydrolase n=1 Tax=Alginatibacterium sediminis TaxID=2164068 RepID=A0A420E8P2_9ALTE|nr:alpha/beta hydrolase [Alginatibacterium sediminis]RKF15757.1 alpha/beta hydrolase [Alginatibacterium sediminis]
MSDNLSESLFKPQVLKRETSTLSNAKASQLQVVPHSTHGAWYRLLRRQLWAWQGVPALGTEALLSQIAVCQKTRTSELLDTVAGYQPGNWTYEWTQRAVHHQTKAKLAAEEGNSERAYDQHRIAFHCASIASFPHYRGDDSAASAQVIAHTNFVSAVAHHGTIYRQIKVPYEGRFISCNLLLPDTDSVKPVVVVSGSVDSIQSDYWPFYEKFLGPAGFAMLTVDIPGCGSNSRWHLKQDSTQLHMAVLNHLKNVPWVDSERVAMLGYRFGGNLAIRVGFLAPMQLKAIITIGSPVDHVYSSVQAFHDLPQMMRDCLANRFGEDSSYEDKLFYSARSLSLKTQGLLGSGKIQAPVLAMIIEDDELCPAQDAQLISSVSRCCEMKTLKNTQITDRLSGALNEATLWLQKHL